MGIALVALATSGVIGIAAGYLVLRIARYYGKPVAGLLGAIVVAFVAAVSSLYPVLFLYVDAATETLIAMDPREGEARLRFVGLPPNTTTDFCYRFSPVGVTILADFNMSEADFLAWMDSRKWKAVEFSFGPNETGIDWTDGAHTYLDMTVYPVRQYESHTPLQVKHGYCFYKSRPDNPDNTVTVIYDLDSGRAYVQHTTY